MSWFSRAREGKAPKPSTRTDDSVNSAPALSDADAIEVLLALGAGLEWESDGTFAFTPSGEDSYQAHYEPNSRCWRATKNWQIPGLSCNSHGAARAACEYHFSTGKWEPERYLEVQEQKDTVSEM